MAKRETKCPHCKQWTEWQGELHDRCHHCDELLEQEEINRLLAAETQRRIAAEAEQVLLDQQNPFVRKLSNYVTLIFIGFMLSVIAVVVLFAA